MTIQNSRIVLLQHLRLISQAIVSQDNKRPYITLECENDFHAKEVYDLLRANKILPSLPYSPPPAMPQMNVECVIKYNKPDITAGMVLDALTASGILVNVDGAALDRLVKNLNEQQLKG